MAPTAGVASDVPRRLMRIVSTSRTSIHNLVPTRRCRESRNRTVLLEIDRWEQRLEESGDSQLAPIAENLCQLRALLTADTLDGTAIGLLLGC